MLLDIRNLHASYGLSEVLFGLSLDVKEGEIVTTGVITEFFSAGLEDDIEVEFEHLGRVTVKF